ncbi:MAG: phenol hydroxylase [Nevskiaceae bacterium]|nr:MAG: phenol hydroxylase [Nevskiaceae bacterium]TBR72662.1 MAG: phenol hydroxylase [Nevskiaceae bacterium]
MAIIARKPYDFPPADSVEHYHGDQLIYMCWGHHLMFAAPFMTMASPKTSFGEFLKTALEPIIALDPDAAKVDWTKVEWTRRGKAFKPALDKSLQDNGIVHKEYLRFDTPGLNTVCG